MEILLKVLKELNFDFRENSMCIVILVMIGK